MEERRAMSLAVELCGGLMEETEKSGETVPVIHPQAILLSSDGTISFSKEDIPEYVKEAYYPPEYVKGFTSKENIWIYALGMLLLFLVTGQDKKSMMDAMVRNQALKATINKCTALDTRCRFQSLMEVQASLDRELTFPKRRMNRILLVLALSFVAGASGCMFMRGKTLGAQSGNDTGYKEGYMTGYENGISDAPGIGIENVESENDYGNLAGNLNSQHGAFAVMGGSSIFYAHNGCVYRMDPYERETVLLAEHETISNLNYWKEHLYYLTEEALVRMNVETKEEEVISGSIWGRFCIYDGTLFIDDEKSGGYLYGIDIETLEIKQLNAQKEHAYMNASNESLYYADPENGYSLFSCDYDGGNDIRLLSRPCRDIDLCLEKLYCLTGETHTDSNAGMLMSMDLKGNDVELITNQPVSRFIARESGVFYISSETGFLEWMTPDGKMRYTICTSAVSDFNLAGRWVFYRIDGEEALYCMQINGSDSRSLP